MNVLTTRLEGVLVLEPRVFSDARGFFLETFHHEKYAQAGVGGPFVQDNWSHSVKDTLRGMHFQHPRGQGKLVWVVKGAVYDAVVDIRVGSPTFGQWYGCELSEGNRRQLWVPPGFAHGFCVLSAEADFVYKCTEVYVPGNEQSLAWNDPKVGIDWPVKEPLLSGKDAAAKRLHELTGLPSFHAT